MLLLLDGLGPGDDAAGCVRNMVNAQRAVLGFRAEHLDGAGATLPGEVERMLAMADAGDPTLLTAPSTSHVSAVDDAHLACAITASAGYGSGALVDGTGTAVELAGGLGVPAAALRPGPGENGVLAAAYTFRLFVCLSVCMSVCVI